jgi:hypothetical protein
VKRAPARQGDEIAGARHPSSLIAARVVWNLELMSVLETERRLNKWR